MRICIEANQLLVRWSGVRRYADNLITNLVEIDRENHYVLYYYPRFFGRRPLSKITGKNISQRVLPLPARSAQILWHTFGFPKIERWVGQIDIFHAIYSDLPPTAAPSVLTVLDITYLINQGLVGRRNTDWYEYYLKSVLPEQLKKVKKVIVVSQQVKKDLLRFFPLPQEKVSVVPLGVEERFFPKLNNGLVARLSQFDLLPGKYILNVAGTLEPRKNLPILIKAYQKLSAKKTKNCPLVIIAGSGALPPQVRTEISMSKGRIRYLNGVADELMPVLYQGAKIFIYPSLYEGFGLPVLEAMAAGVPVVSSNVSAIPEVVGRAGLLVNPRQPQEIALAMKGLLTNRSLRQKLVVRGKLRAKKFSWQRTAQETLKVYEEIYASKHHLSKH